MSQKHLFAEPSVAEVEYACPLCGFACDAAEWHNDSSEQGGVCPRCDHDVRMLIDGEECKGDPFQDEQLACDDEIEDRLQEYHDRLWQLTQYLYAIASRSSGELYAVAMRAKAMAQGRFTEASE